MIGILAVVLLFQSQDARFSTRTFASEHVTVQLWSDHDGIMPVLLKSDVKADTGTVEIFYYRRAKLQDGREADLLARKTSPSCAPVHPGDNGSACDYVEGLTLEQVEFIRVRLHSNVIETDIKPNGWKPRENK